MSLGAKWRDRTVDRRVTDFMTFDLGGGSFHDFNFFFLLLFSSLILLRSMDCLSHISVLFYFPLRFRRYPLFCRDDFLFKNDDDYASVS